MPANFRQAFFIDVGTGPLPDRIENYRRIWSVFQLLLLAVTYPLWIGASDFPQVGLLTSLPTVGAVFDGLLLTVLVAGLALQWSKGITKHYRTLHTVGLWLVIISFLVEFAIDQHRIQAWAYHSLFVAILLLPVKHPRDAEPTLARLRWLVIGVYLYSCLSKLDATFVNNLGPSMLGQLLDYIGIASDSMPEWLRFGLVLLLPLAEGLIGIFLLFQRTRSIGWVLAIAMHAGLIAVVGPWGWQHQWGVVAWNIFFIVQAIVLFRATGVPNEVEHPEENLVPSPRPDGNRLDFKRTGFTVPFARAAFAFVMIFPALAWVGVADHWPSWELYAPRTSRADVWVSAHSAHQLPASVSEHLETAQADGWRRLDIAAWSLRSQYAPIYPEDRFQIGVALGLRRWIKDERSVRVQWRGAADRWTGERETKWLYGYDQISQFANTFRLNAKPNTTQ